MRDTRPSWLWALPATFILPVLHSAIFALRFGIDRLLEVPEHSGDVRLPLGDVNSLVQSLTFLPAGAIVAFALLFWVRAAPSRKAGGLTLLGYLVGLPFAFIGSLMLPLLLDPWIGATLGGALPWLLFTGLGHRSHA
jgi:hypothetical protein